jgi:hypothetical protein
MLNRLLSGTDVAGVGELRWLWRRGVLEGQSCSCGKRWIDCELWGVVLPCLAREYRRDERSLALHADLVADRSSSVFRQRIASRRTILQTRQYAALLRRLYELIAETAGASVVVDTSKHPGHAALARETGLDVTVVHLVRDPRAVVWSYGRKRRAPDKVVARNMRSRPASYVAARWVARNALVELAIRPDIRLRYEDVVNTTDASLSEILTRVGRSTARREAPVHAIAGNLNRFEVGPWEVRADEEWKNDQPRRERLLTTAIAFPLIRRYGYSIGD